MKFVEAGGPIFIYIVGEVGETGDREIPASAMAAYTMMKKNKS